MTDRHSGCQVALLIPPFILVFLVIIAEAYLDGRKVLPHIIVLFSLYNVHANKKALVQKEKSRFLLSCKAHKKTKKPVNIQERRFGFGWKTVSGGTEGCRKHHNPGGYSSIIWVGMCRPGLQNRTPF